MVRKKNSAETVDLESLPGHHIRRLQQIAVAVFLQETETHGVTPVQYAALQTVADAPDVDQRTLARSIGLDTSTTAGVIDRLEARGLMLRNASPDDRRVRLLFLLVLFPDIVLVPLKFLMNPAHHRRHVHNRQKPQKSTALCASK